MFVHFRHFFILKPSLFVQKRRAGESLSDAPEFTLNRQFMYKVMDQILFPVLVNDLSGKRSCDDSHGINLDRVAAAGEVVDLSVQAKENRAVCFKVTHALSDLVADVA